METTAKAMSLVNLPIKIVDVPMLGHEAQDAEGETIARQLLGSPSEVVSLSFMAHAANHHQPLIEALSLALFNLEGSINQYAPEECKAELLGNLEVMMKPLREASNWTPPEMPNWAQSGDGED